MSKTHQQPEADLARSDDYEDDYPAKNSSFEAMRHFHDVRRHSSQLVAPLQRKLSSYPEHGIDYLQSPIETGDLGMKTSDYLQAEPEVPGSPAVDRTQPVKIRPLFQPETTQTISHERFEFPDQDMSPQLNFRSPERAVQARTSSRGHQASQGNFQSQTVRNLYGWQGSPVAQMPSEKSSNSLTVKSHTRVAQSSPGIREPYMGVTLPCEDDDLQGFDGFDVDDDAPEIPGARSKRDGHVGESTGSIPDMLRRASGASLQSLGQLLRRIEDDDTADGANAGRPKQNKSKSSIDWRKRLLSLDIAPTIHESGSPGLDTGSVNDYDEKDDRHLSVTTQGSHFPILKKDSRASDGFWTERTARASCDVKLDTAGPGIIHVGNAAEPYKSGLQFLLGAITSILVLVATFTYLILRYIFTSQAINKVDKSYSTAWAFLAAEGFIAMGLAISAVHSVFTFHQKSGARLRIRGEENLPVVDVCILSGSFPDAVVMDTVAAALALDYPMNRYRVMVIDNGDSRDLQRQVEMFRQTRTMNLTYHKVTWSCTKASQAHPRGNAVDFAIQQRNGRGPGAFVAILDGDMIPELGFLRAMVPHIVHDQFVGMVTCASTIYNLPKTLPPSLAAFIRAGNTNEAARSGLLLRRSAMNDIGGFPTYSSVDDNAVKFLLAGKGYVTVPLSEPLQSGMVSLSFVDNMRSAKALRLGAVKLALNTTCFFGPHLTGLSNSRKIQKAGQALRPLFGLVILISMIIFPAAYLNGGILVPVVQVHHLSLLLQVTFALLLTSRMFDLFWGSALSSTLRFKLQCWAFMAPYDFFYLISILVPPFLRRNIPIQNRQRATNEKLTSRLWTVLISGGAWMHLVLLSTIVASLATSLHQTLEWNLNGTYSLYQTGLVALMTVLWPTMFLFDIVIGLSIPLNLAIFPPIPAYREDLILRDQFSNVARPKHEKRSQFPFKVKKSVELATSGGLLAFSLLLVVFSLIPIPVK